PEHGKDSVPWHAHIVVKRLVAARRPGEAGRGEEMRNDVPVRECRRLIGEGSYGFPAIDGGPVGRQPAEVERAPVAVGIALEVPAFPDMEDVRTVEALHDLGLAPVVEDDAGLERQARRELRDAL